MHFTSVLGVAAATFATLATALPAIQAPTPTRAEHAKLCAYQYDVEAVLRGESTTSPSGVPKRAVESVASTPQPIYGDMFGSGVGCSVFVKYPKSSDKNYILVNNDLCLYCRFYSSADCTGNSWVQSRDSNGNFANEIPGFVHGIGETALSVQC